MAKQLGIKGQKRRTAAKRDTSGKYSSIANSVSQRRYIRSLRNKMKRVGGRQRATAKNIYTDRGALKRRTR